MAPLPPVILGPASQPFRVTSLKGLGAESFSKGETYDSVNNCSLLCLSESEIRLSRSISSKSVVHVKCGGGQGEGKLDPPLGEASPRGSPLVVGTVHSAAVFLFQLILGIPEQALSLLHMAIEPILADGAVLDKGRAMFLVAKCQVASAASYEPPKKAEGRKPQKDC